MPNGHDGADGVANYAILSGTAGKISKSYGDLPAVTNKWNEIIAKEITFESEIDRADIYLAMLCVLALIFDFIVSRITMVPLTKSTNISPEIMALIFNLMDGIIAVLASGILANGLAAKFKAKRIWLPVLWLLCAVKIALYIGFAYSKVTIIGMLFIIFLVVIVYIILHSAGRGLYFLIGIIKFWVLKSWFDNPVDVENALQKEAIQLKKEVAIYNFNLASVLTFFGFNDEIRNNYFNNGGN